VCLLPELELAMRRTRLIRPEYSERFRCIGPACEDSCCQGWDVHIDQETYAKYQALPAGPLKVLMDANLVPTPKAGPAQTDLSQTASAQTDPAKTDPGNSKGCAASIRMGPELACPFLSVDRLCRIQTERGEQYLSHVCASFPRIESNIDNMAEKALSLSCPEAARLVLLDRSLLTREFKGFNLDWDDTIDHGRALLPYFWTIREFVVGLAANRDYPLWQRLFLLGTLCRRLEAIATGELARRVPDLLSDFSAAIANGALRPTMDRIEPDLAMQLDMVLRIGGLGRGRIPDSPRFIECMTAFKRGIGLEPGVAPEALVARYAAADERCFAPFIAQHPHILENYLVNAIFRRQFPFGLRNGQLEADPRPAREFALLATQFALIKGLLIGVAGFHGERFSTAHVVHTVQSANKHFDHSPEFLTEVRTLLASIGRDNPHGLTMLLRNHEAPAAVAARRRA